MLPQCSKVAPLAEEKPANGASEAGETMPKPKRKRPRLTPLAGGSVAQGPSKGPDRPNR
jgi:hypothetical protein